MGLNDFILKEKKMENRKKKKNPGSHLGFAQFWWKLAGLSVLFSRQILNGYHGFFITLIF